MKEAGRVFPQVKLMHVKKLPFVVADKTKQQEIATLVLQILAAKKRDPKADATALEQEIDRLVYQLYDLTPEEIAIVEEAAGGK